MPQHVIIAGGRDFYNEALISSILLELVEEGWLEPEPVIISGMANGADITAYNLCKYHFKLQTMAFPADWQDMSEPCVVKYTRTGSAYNALAGMKRNTEMMKAACSLIAFWDGRSRGTKDMIDKMTKANKRVRVIRY